MALPAARCPDAGTLQLKNGSSYDGEWADDRFQGQGELRPHPTTLPPQPVPVPAPHSPLFFSLFR